MTSDVSGSRGLGTGKVVAFLNEKVVEATDGEDLGMPVMQHKTSSLGYLVDGKTFHAGP